MSLLLFDVVPALLLLLSPPFGIAAAMRATSISATVVIPSAGAAT
jgi:hypothetical protein